LQTEKGKTEMKRLMFGVTLCAALLGAGESGAREAEGSCVPIGGEALGQFYNDSKDVVAPMSGTWAAARGTVLSQKQTPTGLSLEMEHVFSTSDGGVVRTHDQAELTAVPGKRDTYMLELAYTVVESFGRLKGYAGTFNSYGLFKMGSGEVLVRYNGQICK
jgi:hypothetical protein